MEENPQKHGFNFGFWGYVISSLVVLYFLYAGAKAVDSSAGPSGFVSLLIFIALAVGVVLTIIGLFKKGTGRGWAIGTLLSSLVLTSLILLS